MQPAMIQCTYGQVQRGIDDTTAARALYTSVTYETAAEFQITVHKSINQTFGPRIGESPGVGGAIIKRKSAASRCALFDNGDSLGSSEDSKLSLDRAEVDYFARKLYGNHERENARGRVLVYSEFLMFGISFSGRFEWSEDAKIRAIL